MTRFQVILACVAAASLAGAARAQNLLVNGGLESSPAFSYYDGVSSTNPNLVPGWTMFGDTPPDVSSYVQVSLDATPMTIDLDLSGGETNAADPDTVGLAGIMTAAGSRPAVFPNGAYLASVTYDNYAASAGISYFIDWFNGAGVLISSDGGPLADPNGPSTYEPYTQLFQFFGTAPATAATAGVRFLSATGDFNGATADNFGLFNVPEPCTLSIAIIAGLSLAARRRVRQPATTRRAS